MGYLDDKGLQKLISKIKTSINANEITVDSALSATSTNPVQNKVLSEALYEKASVWRVNNQYSQIYEDFSHKTIDSPSKKIEAIGNIKSTHVATISIGNLYHKKQIRLTFLKSVYAKSKGTAVLLKIIVSNPMENSYYEKEGIPIVIARNGNLYRLPYHKINSGTYTDGYYYFCDAFTSFDLVYLENQDVYGWGTDNVLLVKNNPIVLSYQDSNKEYMVYANGLIEQSIFNESDKKNNTYSWPVEFSSNKYFCNAGFVIEEVGRQLVTKTPDSITLSSDAKVSGLRNLYARGY